MTDKQIIKTFSDGYCLVLHENRVSLRENNYTKYQIVVGAKTNELFEFVKELYLDNKAKEQECEELKKIINEAKNSKLDLNSFFAIEATVGEYQLELDQLKAENDTYKKMFEDEDVQLALTEIRTGERHLWFNKAEKYYKTLTEIKELIQSDYCTEIGSCEFCAEIGNCLNRKILQKISEVEDGV